MTTDTVGGVWSYSLELCRALLPHGVTVELATMGTPLTTAQRAAVDGNPNVRVHESTYRLEWMDEPWDDVSSAGEWLLDIAADTAPDIVHLNGYAHAVLPWRSPVLLVAHSCVLSWWQAVRGTPPPRQWTRYAAAVRRGIASADLVVAPTRAMLSACHEHYGAPRRSAVIPNGTSLVAAAAARQPLVLAAGRAWDESKNMAMLDAAAPSLRWPVHVAGPTTSPDGATCQFRNLRALGALPSQRMRTTYAEAAIFAHPAVYEPFGLAPLEAALHGCALVLGDIPSLREVWGDAATYVNPRDCAALIDAINALIDDDDARTAAADRARRRAARYTAWRMARAYAAAYRRHADLGPAREVASCAS